MASLTGQLVAETYKALLKTIDNDILTASEKQITDGFGGGSNVFIDSQGFLRANKYKVTNGLATQFLKADGSLDSNTYLTGITSSQIIAALGYTPVPTTRTLTINGTTYDLSANRSWTIEGTAAVWGNISGTLSNQTDLQTALNAKYNNPTGTISQYIRGDGSLATFPTLPGGLPTGGTAGQILSKIDATDYNTHWIDNYATQTKNEVKLGQTLTKGTPVYVSSANGTNMIVSAASNASEATSSKTLGLLETGGATNDLVKCVTFGLLAGLDTSTATAGDPVWLGVNGALIFGLANKPYAPAHLVYIGVVTRVQSNNGEIFVNVQNGFELKEIHDVSAQSPTNNDGLFYESSTGLWKNKSIATVLGYTPQAQLSGTGFVKASGTTISYDNSTYLTTTDAASTYQRLDKMVSNLLASATEYPNSNAVIAALALKANAENPVFTGNMTISGAEPKLYFTDTDQNPDYFIGADAGFFRIYDQTAGQTRFVINSSGVTTIAGDLIVGTIAKSGGTASQFLKADGSIDSSTYVTSASLANYLLISTAASTYQRLDKMVSNLLASSTEYPNSNAVIAALALKADAANPVFTGDMTISGISPKLYFTDTDNNPDYTLFVDSGYFYIYDQTAGATKFQITPSGNAINTGTLTSASFIKSGGTSSQYLMADGSVSTLTNPVTGSGTANYLSKWTSGSGIGNSQIYDNGTNLSIGTLVGVTEQLLKLAGQGTSYGMTITSSLDNTTVSTLAGVNVLFLLNTFSGSHASIGLSSNDSDGQHHRAVIGAKKDSAGIYAGKLDFILRQIGGAYATKATLLANGNLGLGTETPGFKLDVVGYAKADYFTSLDGVSYQGLGVYNNTFIGIGDRASALIINDIDGARYAVSAGGYSLTFSKNVSGTSWATAMAIIATSTSDNSPVVRVYSKLGVGKTPSDIFDVNGTSSFSDNMTLTKNNGYIILNRTSTTSYLGINHRTSGSAKWFVGMRENGTDDYIIYNETTATDVLRITGTASVFSGTLQANGISTISGGVDGTFADAFVSKYSGNNNEQNAIQTTVSSVAANSGFRFQASNGGGSSSRTNVADFRRDRSIFYTGIYLNSTNAVFSSNANILQIGNNGIIENVVGTQMMISNNAYYTGSLWKYVTTAEAQAIRFGAAVAGDISFHTVSSGTAGSNISGWDDVAVKLYISPSGNIGVNTNSPSSIFTINKTNTNYTSISEAHLLLSNPSSTGQSSIYYTFNGVMKSKIRTDYVGSLNYVTNGGDHYFFTGGDAGTGTAKVRILNSGQLLIGNVSSSSSFVEINGGSTNYGGGEGHLKVTSAATGQTVLNITNTSVPRSYEFAVGGSSSGEGAGTFYIYDTTAGASRFKISASGAVTAVTSVTTPEIYINGDNYITFNNERGVWGIRSRTTSSTANLGTSLKNIILCGGGANEGFAVMGYQMTAAFEVKNSGVGYFLSSVNASAFYESSDMRLKTLIDGSAQIEGIENLEAKLYEKNGKIELGYFAQDAEKLMPYAVTKNLDGFLNLSYREVHTAKIARLEKRVAELEKQLNLN